VVADAFYFGTGRFGKEDLFAVAGDVVSVSFVDSSAGIATWPKLPELPGTQCEFVLWAPPPSMHVKAFAPAADAPDAAITLKTSALSTARDPAAFRLLLPIPLMRPPRLRGWLWKSDVGLAIWPGPQSLALSLS
jgi:hypothetical protein